MKGDEPSKVGSDAMSTHIMDGLRYGITGTFPTDGVAMGIMKESAPEARRNPLPIGRDVPAPVTRRNDWTPIAGAPRNGF